VRNTWGDLIVVPERATGTERWRDARSEVSRRRSRWRSRRRANKNRHWRP